MGTSAVSARARRAPTDPSAVAARLRVVSSSRRLAEPLTGTAAHSHSAYSCPGDCLPHVCRLRNNVDHVLRWTAEVNFGLKRVGASRLPRPGFRSEDASMRPEVQFHASSAAFPSHAAPVAVCGLRGDRGDFRTCCEDGGRDAAVFFASGWLLWLSRSAWGRGSSETRRSCIDLGVSFIA